MRKQVFGVVAVALLFASSSGQTVSSSHEAGTIFTLAFPRPSAL